MGLNMLTGRLIFSNAEQKSPFSAGFGDLSISPPKSRNNDRFVRHLVHFPAGQASNG